MTTLCDIILPKIMSTITNSAMGVGITLTAGIVLKLAAVYFVLRIIDGAAQYFMSGIGHIMGVHIETDMRRDAFDHLLKLDHTYYNNTKVGTIMGRITNDLFDVTEFAHHCPEEFFIAGIKILASFLILCQASVPLTLAVFACVPLMGVVSVKLNQRLRARFRQQRVQIGELNATIEDSLLGQGVVKAFAAEDEEREKFARGNKDFENIKTLGYYAMAAFNTSTRLFDGLMYLVVILAGGLSLVYGKITAGDLVAYMLYVTTLIATIRRIVEFAEQFQRGMTGIERFAEIMDTPVTIKDAEDARPLQPGPGAIRFEDVSFEYPDDHNKVLHHVSLDIKAGERLALVGPSGGGKTTLCNLIPRFYEVTGGRILIDGQDIHSQDKVELRRHIGYVIQQIGLFPNMTVEQNILSALKKEKDPAARRAACAEALRAMRLEELAKRLPGALSGGQQQRAALARILAAKPRILMLDEPFSALDSYLREEVEGEVGSLLAGFASSFSNRLLVTHGTAAVAAMAAAGKTTMVISMIAMAICMGCQPLLAYSYGASDSKRLKQLLKDLILLTVVFGVLAGAASFAGRNALIGMFIKEEGAFRLGTQLVVYLVLGSPVIGLTYLATSLLQSVGKASGAVVLSLLRQGLLLIPLLYLMNALCGVQGIAAAHLMADVGAAVISAGILLHWLRASVEKTAEV